MCVHHMILSEGKKLQSVRPPTLKRFSDLWGESCSHLASAILEQLFLVQLNSVFRGVRTQKLLT